MKRKINHRMYNTFPSNQEQYINYIEGSAQCTLKINVLVRNKDEPDIDLFGYLANPVTEMDIRLDIAYFVKYSTRRRKLPLNIRYTGYQAGRIRFS